MFEVVGIIVVERNDLPDCPMRKRDERPLVGNESSVVEESFSDGLLEYPQYTRPASFRGWEVPPVLRSGDHGRVGRWRRAAALARTLRSRPDLIEAAGGLSEADRRLVEEFGLMP